MSQEQIMNLTIPQFFMYQSCLSDIAETKRKKVVSQQFDNALDDLRKRK